MLVDWAKEFPKLSKSGYQRTSPATIDYNCLAWALGYDNKWWEPDPYEVGYWPEGLPRDGSLATYLKACGSEGFRKCRTGDLEQGYDKIAIFSRDGQFTHAARQLDNGRWTSKLGEGDDITHDLEGLNGDKYGQPTIFMKNRPG